LCFATFCLDDLNDVVVGYADCYSKDPGFESWVSYGPFHSSIYENEMKMKWKWNENEMKMKWKWNENEMKMKWKWNENEMKMKW
jgi:hypothetical protein